MPTPLSWHCRKAQSLPRPKPAQALAHASPCHQKKEPTAEPLSPAMAPMTLQNTKLVYYSNFVSLRSLSPEHQNSIRSSLDGKEKKESRPSRVGSPEETRNGAVENASAFPERFLTNTAP